MIGIESHQNRSWSCGVEQKYIGGATTSKFSVPSMNTWGEPLNRFAVSGPGEHIQILPMYPERCQNKK